LAVGLFVTLGEKLGQCFNDVETLTGYTVNVAFSLLGGLFYSALTMLETGPVVWMAFAALLLLPFFLKSKVTLLVFSCLILLPWFLVPKDVIWSPYYRIDVVPVSITANNGTQYMIGHNVNVNHDGILSAFDGTDQFAQSLPPELRAMLLDYYNVPYRIFGDRFQNVMVIGAGAGNDVAAALRNGATSVDAVEIDPAIANIGRQIHPELPYQSDKVKLHITDGRAFLRDPAHRNYDLIVFGALDSHSVFSSMSSIRLDNYVYTVESFRDAINDLKPNGVIAVTFYFYKQFQLERVYNALCLANGTKPIIVRSFGGARNNFVILAGPGADRNVLLANPHVLAQNAEYVVAGGEAVQPTTDD
jgi:spermidine synthase